jgi:drug/metabolite transporter superfamily protein YnfA
MKKQPTSEFEKAAAAPSRGGFLGELWDFLKANKKWWLLPIIILFLILAVLILLAGTGLAPFIYTLF